MHNWCRKFVGNPAIDSADYPAEFRAATTCSRSLLIAVNKAAAGRVSPRPLLDFGDGDSLLAKQPKNNAVNKRRKDGHIYQNQYRY